MVQILHKIWQQKIQAGEINQDAHQATVVTALDTVLDALLMQKQHAPSKRKWLSFMERQPHAPYVTGLYIYGSVGRGKSMLMDLFHEQILQHDITSMRCHFHEFMYQVPLKLKEHKERYAKEDNPLNGFAKDIRKQAQILCFDEFQVSNIADAMILAKLFSCLFQQGITVITTSNVAPTDLYQNGLHRDRFLPFIDILQEYTKILNMDGDTDHRMGSCNVGDGWFAPRNDENIACFFESFGMDSPSSHDIKLAIGSYQLQIMHQHKQSLMVDYKELCCKPRGVKEYAYLCQNFKEIYLYGLPQLEGEKEAAKRFVHFVDIAYEYGVSLKVLADTPLSALKPAAEIRDIFPRTASRLNELC